MAKAKAMSEIVLKSEFDFYEMSVWAEDKNKPFSITNNHNGKVYSGVDAKYLKALIMLEKMRREKVKVTPVMELTNLYNKHFSAFDVYLDAKGISLIDFLAKFKTKAKSTSAPKLYEALLKECFPYAIPRNLRDALYARMMTVNNNVSFNNFINKNFVKLWGSDKAYFPLMEGSWKNQNLLIYKNNLAMWLAVVGMGVSFHKVLGHNLFSKFESHNFLTAPVDLSVGEALVYAVAYTHKKDRACALKLAKNDLIVEEVNLRVFGLEPFVSTSVINHFTEETVLEYAELNIFNASSNRVGFTKTKFIFDVIRFLMTELVEAEEVIEKKKVGEVFDFLSRGYWPDYMQKTYAGELIVNNQNERNSNKKFKDRESDKLIHGLNPVHPNPFLYKPELFGRKLSFSTLYVQTVAWHYELASKKIIGDGSWDGVGIVDCNWREVDKTTGNLEAEIFVKQILTAVELQREGRLMRHCVSSYAASCRMGTCGIFQMYQVSKWGEQKKMLTIRVNNAGDIVEARGLANRNPKPRELTYLNDFARINSLRICTRY